MQLVIEISEADYEYFKNTSFVEHEDCLRQSSEDRKGTMNLFRLVDAVKDGIVLPEGHGDLIDRSKILPYMESRLDMQDLYLPTHFKDFVIDELQIVVPADEEGEADAETDKG